MKRSLDISQQRFGKLVAIKEVGKTKRGQAIWLCKCDCGKECTKRADVLKSGCSNSCGCIRKEMGKLTIENAHHGRDAKSKHVKKDRLYQVWCGMKKRCSRKSHPAFKYYGGRGIKVCDEWKNDYLSFRKWAYLTGYDENAKFGECTIDRIDNDGIYEPTNCRWVSMKEQSKNKRNHQKRRLR